MDTSLLSLHLALNTAALAALQHLPVLISSLLPPTGGSSSVPLNSCKLVE